MTTAKRITAALLMIMSVLQAGCTDKKQTAKTTTNTEKEDPLATVREMARKDHDLESCKTIIHQINAHLANSNTAAPELTSSDRALIETQLNLTADEWRELNAVDFTTLDAHYLFQCLLLFDSLHGLVSSSAAGEADGLSRARSGFAWAMRQVWPSPQEGPPLAPAFVLKRGSGGEPERAALALAVFQQLGFDSCLVGQEQPDRGIRMWSVGVAINSNVYLFDPGNGTPFLSDGGQVVTLKDVRAKPEMLKTLDRTPASKDNPIDIAKCKLYVSPPLSALAPRMRVLEQALRLQPKLNMSISLSESLDRWAKLGEKPVIWNPKQEISTPVRSLVYFLPTDEGGLDRNPRGRRRHEIFVASLAPLGLIPPIVSEQSISGMPGHQLRSRFGARFILVFDMPNQPRDQILRGQLEDATAGLVELLKQTSMQLERAGQEARLDADAAEWVQQMRSASAQLERAQNQFDQNRIAEAKAQIELLNKQSTNVNLLIERAAAEPFGIALTYQLALCKHEQAVRQTRQSRGAADLQSVKDAWRSAASWWSNFLSKYGAVPYLPKGMADQAKQLLAEAQSSAN